MYGAYLQAPAPPLLVKGFFIKFHLTYNPRTLTKNHFQFHPFFPDKKKKKRLYDFFTPKFPFPHFTLLTIPLTPPPNVNIKTLSRHPPPSPSKKRNGNYNFPNTPKVVNPSSAKRKKSPPRYAPLQSILSHADIARRIRKGRNPIETWIRHGATPAFIPPTATPFPPQLSSAAPFDALNSSLQNSLSL